MSGVHQGCHWVTLGFSSRLESQDVLHIVVGIPPATQLRRAARPYLERFDQSLASESGAKLVDVGGGRIQVHLTRAGQQELGFSDPVVVFTGASRLKGHSEALDRFRQMAQCTRYVVVNAQPKVTAAKAETPGGRPR